MPNIENLIEISGNKKLVLKILKISTPQLGGWQKMKKYECKESLIWLCYKILSCDVNEKLSGAIRLNSLRNGINDQFLQKKDLKIDTQNLDQIVDGGSDNNNVTIHEFIKNCKVGIDKKIALKDVLFSNSLIEGNNRILKQTYLKDKELTQKELPDYITESIKEYNSEKPHYVHKIYTPDET